MTAREALLAALRVRETAALDYLGASAGGLSLCALSRAGTSIPAAKYHEGSVAALAEARRAVQRTGDGPDGASDVWAGVRDVRAHWLTQVGIAGRTGPDWTGYLTGGLDALEQVEHLLDDEGRGRVTSRTDPNLDPAAPVARVPASAGPGDPHGSSTGPAVPVPGRFARARAVWPSRRLIVVAVLSPALAAVLVAVGGRLTAAPPAWLALIAAIAVACSATLASYVPRPGEGRRLDIGCTPCASVAALSVVIAAGVLSSSPQDVPTAILALAVAAFGMRQRLTNPSTCAV